MDVQKQVARRLHGPPFVLPPIVDACAERWSRFPSRGRLLAVVLLCIGLASGVHAYVAGVRARWGGTPRRALVAVEDATIGERPRVRAVRLPPAMVPPDAPQTLGPDARLALALPRGAVLTRTHVSPRGPAVGLDRDLRVVPLPVEPGLDIAAGAAVDVWVLAAAPARSHRIASRRPVIGVATDDGDEPIALVALAADEVGAALRGLADGRVLLTQAPP